MSRTSVLDGLDLVTLQARLTAMQLALLDLQSGAQVATASYAQGDGNQSVTYRGPISHPLHRRFLPSKRK